MKAKVVWLAAMICVAPHALSAENKLPVASSDRAFSQKLWTAQLVTAKVKIKPGTIDEVSNRFAYNGGRIYAHATLVSKGPFVPFETTFTFKWFNEGNLIRDVSAKHTVLDSPMYIVHGMLGNELGPGNCRVELYADDQMVGKREFTVLTR